MVLQGCTDVVLQGCTDVALQGCTDGVTGLYTGLTPLYLSEISAPNIRGALGVLHQLGVVCGLLLSQTLGFPEIFGNSSFWDLLLGELLTSSLPLTPALHSSGAV